MYLRLHPSLLSVYQRTKIPVSEDSKIANDERLRGEVAEAGVEVEVLRRRKPAHEANILRINN